ncbi:MAG: sigma-70 family RNA polymerase sigma factor [Acidobacteria bacterium]|nr:sigma-70 family RNA polymerase sigma factor [Acidobacteriota bacterium]MCW5950009.1 sigma-70 family RNA polymerase sigma factor [Pyrinomonadaceae bacterium]
MSPLPDKYLPTIDEAAAHLLARAEQARGLDVPAIRSRLTGAVEKYLFVGGENPEHADIIEFIEGIRADDLCLILACERGDEKAWEDLVANFDQTVRSAARKIASNPEDADDLASSIWAELYGLRTDRDGKKKSKLAYYSGRGSLAGWLRAVVSQLAVDQFRKSSRFVQIEEDREFDAIANEAALSGIDRLTSSTDDPETMVSDQSSADDISDALKEVIGRLDAEDRLLMKLYYFDDLKLKDIAAAFGYHEATASRKLTRVQDEIRKGVEKELKNKHGWTDSEVRRHLSDTAAGLGIDLETMLATLALLILLQDYWL